ncbi:hypothetical protein YC2023_084470 [Brassica napus]
MLPTLKPKQKVIAVRFTLLCYKKHIFTDRKMLLVSLVYLGSPPLHSFSGCRHRLR